MTLVFVVAPPVRLGGGDWRVAPVGVYCGNMLVLALAGGVNLVQVVLSGGAVRETLVVPGVLRVGAHPVALGVHLDFYSAYLVWVVFVVSFLVHLYSTVYLGGDPRLATFLGYLTLFTFFMVVLLVSPNYVQLFMGWEGVGLTSYLLVNFWTTRAAANKSALKALLVNRVGDLCLLWGVFLLAREGHTLGFAPLGTPPGVAALLVGAAAAKSAQLGLHTWLPDAMEGPTPVSALIHAATMVTAGVFLLFRAGPHLEGVRPLLGVLGTLTALFAGTVAVFQFDLKRVIAYSTCSQLGFMVVAYSVGFPELSLYHLGNHAFFKALLFLLAGLVIHALADEQDLRRMGGLVRTLPVTYSLFVVGSLALGGFPFLSGFYSKDSILETLHAGGHRFGYLGCLLAAYLTAFYSARVVSLVFLGPPRGARSGHLAAREADGVSLGVVLLLGGFSLVHGYALRDALVGPGGPAGWAAPALGGEFGVPLWVKLLPLGVSLTGAVGAARVAHLPRLGGFPARRWWWDALDAATARRGLHRGYRLYLDLERGLLEWAGPAGVDRLLARGYDSFRQRGWSPAVWAAGAVGFAGLALAGGMTLTGGEGEPFFPLTPLWRATPRGGRADPR